MNVVVTIIDAFPEKQKEVVQTLISMVEPPGKQKGCLSYCISRDIEDNNVFMLISTWETRQSLDSYIKSERFGILLGIKSLLREPLNIQIFTVSDAEGIKAVDAVRKKR